MNGQKLSAYAEKKMKHRDQMLDNQECLYKKAR